MSEQCCLGRTCPECRRGQGQWSLAAAWSEALRRRADQLAVIAAAKPADEPTGAHRRTPGRNQPDRAQGATG